MMGRRINPNRNARHELGKYHEKGAWQEVDGIHLFQAVHKVMPRDVAEG